MPIEQLTAQGYNPIRDQLFGTLLFHASFTSNGEVYLFLSFRHDLLGVRLVETASDMHLASAFTGR